MSLPVIAGHDRLTKACSKCRRVLPVSDFNISRAPKRHSACRDCCRAATKAWQLKNPGRSTVKTREWRKKNPEKAKALDRKQYLKNPAKQNAANRESYRKHRAARLAACIAWKAANPEKVARYDRDWKRKHPDQVRAKCARRRARKSDAVAGCQKQVEAFYAAARSSARVRCYWCDRLVPKSKRHIDHIVPLSAGGLHEVSNLCCACEKCNTTKGAKSAAAFCGQGVLL